MVDELKMAEFLCTRLCHDLTGPIGAVNNGAEFLSEEGFNLQGQAVELIVSSAFSAVTRLQYYRSAYGHVKDHGEANLAEKQKLAADFFAGSKISLDWPDQHTEASGVSVSLKMSRLIYNLLIIASGALIRGGTIAVRIQQEPEGSKRISVTANGPGLKWDAEFQKILTDDETPVLDPKNVQVCLTRAFLDEVGARLNYTHEENNLLLQVTQIPH
jgi:histidine phosphotransferase ChpT